MTAMNDLSGAFSWTKTIPPPPSDDFYSRWEEEQRDRWAVEALADAMEREHLKQGRREYLGIVSFLIGVAFVCAALLFGAR